MANNSYRDIIDSLVQLYVADDRPWLVGFSGGKDLIEFRETLLEFRNPDDGWGVSRILNKQRGVVMNNDLNELNRLREMGEEVTKELSIRANTLRRMLAKVAEYSESHRAHGLPDDLLNIQDDIYSTTHLEEKHSIH